MFASFPDPRDARERSIGLQAVLALVTAVVIGVGTLMTILGGLVLDLTEDPAWRRHVAEEIKEGLGAQPPELDVPAIVDLRERLRSVRERLTGSINEYY